MLFRQYGNIRPLCICRETSAELEERLDELGQQFDFIDLQFSTHYDSKLNQERFCALLLVRARGE